MGTSCLWASRTKRGYITPVTKIHPPSFPQLLPTSHTTRQATSFYAQIQAVIRSRVGRTPVCAGTAAQAASTCPPTVRIQRAAELCFLPQKTPTTKHKRKCSAPETTVGDKNTRQSEKGHLQNERLQCVFQ